jgi:hypothetical protein
MSGVKEKLMIVRVDTASGNIDPISLFSVTLNPGGYTRSSVVKYNGQERPAGNLDGQPRLDEHEQDKLQLEDLVFDGTGVVDAPAGLGLVELQIAWLRKTLNDPAGDLNVLNAVVDIVWGALYFRGRIAAMTVKYTLFNAAGTPLRARVSLDFVAYGASASSAVQALRMLARQVRVLAGDTLPLLCAKAYNDPSLSPAVALFNGLTSIRRVLPGALVTLPERR